MYTNICSDPLKPWYETVNEYSVDGSINLQSLNLKLLNNFNIAKSEVAIPLGFNKGIITKEKTIVDTYPINYNNTKSSITLDEGTWYINYFAFLMTPYNKQSFGYDLNTYTYENGNVIAKNKCVLMQVLEEGQYSPAYIPNYNKIINVDTDETKELTLGIQAEWDDPRITTPLGLNVKTVLQAYKL